MNPRQHRRQWAVNVALATALATTVSAFGGSPANAAVASGHPQSPITLSLTPDYGPPGTRVTLTGYIPADANLTDQNYGIVNFGSWPNGLPINPDEVSWSKLHSGHFVVHFTVPAVPWLSEHGEVPLQVKPYAVGLQCFGRVSEGCGIRTPEATTTFHMTAPIRSGDRRPTLTLTPSAARPGQIVHISGWAPLTEEFGATPYGYQLSLESGGQKSAYGEIPTASINQTVSQSLNGDLSGTIQFPAFLDPFGPLSAGSYRIALSYEFTNQEPLKGGKPSANTVVLDATTFHLVGSPSWSSVLGNQRIASLASNQDSGYFDGLAVYGQRLLTANNSGFWTSPDDGRSWRKLPLTALQGTLHAMGYSLIMQPDVTGFTIAPGHATHWFASVPTARIKFGAPPIVDLGLFSTDAGRTWRAVMPPAGMTLDDFGGFASIGKAVWAWWQSSSGHKVVAEATDNGGETWTLVHPTSRTAAGDVLFGPVLAQDYGQMGGDSEQPVVTRNRGDWTTVNSVSPIGGTTSQLATLANGTTLLLNQPEYPIQMTTDSGRHWTYVATPAVPGTVGQSSLPALTLLPNGALLARDPQTGDYYSLHRGADRWLPVAHSDTLPFAAPDVVGNDVYWVDLASQGTNTRPGSPPLLLVVPVARY